MEDNIIYSHKIEVHNPNSAKVVVPELLKLFEIKSVVDVGCGNGSWLSVFKENGIVDLLGFDQVESNQLFIDNESILKVNLGEKIEVKRKFDIALTLEVAEHIEEKSAEIFVKNLVMLSDIVLFSAAIPNQGGQNHLNEQWVDYWLEKFSIYNFELYDGFRFLFWGNSDVDWWYQQNMFLFIKNNKKISDKIIKKDTSNILKIIHPDLYAYRVGMIKSFITKNRIETSQFDHLSFEKISIKSAFLILINSIKEFLNKKN